MENDPEQDDWEHIWNARLEALKPILGESGDTVLHAMIPFQFGGAADVMIFPEYLPGMTYVTGEMTGDDTGQQPSSLGNYELMICVKQELEQAGQLIAELGAYTCESVIEPGHTMDLESFFGDSTIRGLVFTHPGDSPVQFEVLGQRCGLLLCIGITAEEIAYAKEKGSEQVISALKAQAIFPYTILDRPSITLPD